MHFMDKNTKKPLDSSWILKYKQHKSTEDRPNNHWYDFWTVAWSGFYFVIVGVVVFFCFLFILRLNSK